jgi:CRISPR-associated protein Cas5 subtype I-B
MIGLQFHVSGRWAQFRKPETNNTPLTHDFVTKTAIVGIMGAVLGIERPAMRELFPILCEDVLYGVQILGTVDKQSWAFTLRNVHKQNDRAEKAPRQMEFIREPSYTVVMALVNDRSAEMFSRFAAALRNGEASFTPVLGLHNCPAELEWLMDCAFEKNDSNEPYTTHGFALADQKFSGEISQALHIGFERMPTFQDNNWWNVPNKYVNVIYPVDGVALRMVGEHYTTSSGAEWCLI